MKERKKIRPICEPKFNIGPRLTLIRMNYSLKLCQFQRSKKTGIIKLTQWKVGSHDVGDIVIMVTSWYWWHGDVFAFKEIGNVDEKIIDKSSNNINVALISVNFCQQDQFCQQDWRILANFHNIVSHQHHWKLQWLEATVCSRGKILYFYFNNVFLFYFKRCKLLSQRIL